MTGVGFLIRLLGNHADEQLPAVHLQTALGARVLVVDDSPTICAVLGKMLGQEGYAVVKATDGKSAIDLACSEKPALIFLDVVMPGMNGFTVLRKLRHDPLTHDIPIIMISGNQQATEQFYLQRYGADDFMKKPFGGDDVYRRISQLVASGRLAARKPSDLVDAAVIASSSASLDAIPDIAMPDAEHAQAVVSVEAERKISAAA
jgi:twitching motility two-component system response regulator PilH